MSRLLTTLLLYRNGFYVGKYISLESKIAKNKDLYYNAPVRHRTAGMKVLRTLFLLSNIYSELFLLLIRILKIVLHWWKPNCLHWRQ